MSALVRSQRLLQLETESQDEVRRSLSQSNSPTTDARISPPVLSSLPEPLTARELDVLKLVILGMTNRQIGKQLFISTGTVKIHIEHII